MNIKKILNIVLWIIGLSGLMTSLAFVGNKEKDVQTENLLINVNNTDVNTFIDEEDIKDFFNERKDSILHTSVKKIDVNSLEKALNSHPVIENADVAVDVNGDIIVEVTQRTPVVRIINTSGESYYIDNTSKLMPLSDKYTARVIVATGNIIEPYAIRHTLSVDDITKNKTYASLSVLDDIYTVATYINKDSILSNLIHQINITNENELELYPSIGDHKIVFGSVENIEDKFNKLKLFYKEGLNKTDGWNKYAIVNIKYKNQVVCTKK